jgi:hypothetical protein
VASSKGDDNLKYTIMGFKQKKLLELGLKTDDALLLSVIKDIYASPTMESKIFNGEKYIWINYTWLLNQIPIIGSKRNTKRRIEKFEEFGLLDRELEHSKNGTKGNFAYIRPTAKMFELQDYTPYDKMSQGLGQNVLRVGSNCPNKDTSIIDTPIKDNKPQNSGVFIQELRMRLQQKNLTVDPQKVLAEAKGIETAIQYIEWYGDKGPGYLMAAIKGQYGEPVVKKEKTKEGTIGAGSLRAPVWG